jgi:hypothetical protein
MQTSRRTFVGLAAASVSAITLAACAAIDPNATPQQNLARVVTDVDNIVGAFAKSLPQIGAVHGISAATLKTVTDAIGNMQVVGKALADAATSITAAQPLVQQIETDVNAVVDAVAMLPLPPALSAVFQAAMVLLPIIESAVNLSVPAPVAAKAKAAGMSPDEARAILRLNA